MSMTSRAAQEPTERLEAFGIFEAYITEAIPEATLMKYERLYVKATKEEKLTNQIIFDYAVCLIKSRYAADMNRGVILMEDLTLSHPEGNREYLYYLAMGYARLKDYTLAINLLKASLKVEPESTEVLAFKAPAAMTKEAQAAMEKKTEALMEKEAKEANLSVEKYKEYMGYLLETRSNKEIQAVEKVYFEAPDDNEELLIRLRYEYARRLIGSFYYMDVRKGIILMEGVSADDPKNNIDYFFYISLGYARLERYSNALKVLTALNEILPKESRLYEWRIEHYFNDILA
ncbi:hypothetical protein HA402_011001 [Bradysia odoriphaga]|nr:hypothetical protein HA402_011001 [Bradysia odoriphaga]